MNGRFITLQRLKENGGMGKLVTLEYNVLDVLASESKKVSIQTNGYNKLLLKTIRITPSIDTDFEFKVIDSAVSTTPETVYKNTPQFSTGNTKEGIYDIVDLPFVDADISKMIHFNLINKGASTSSFKVKIQALELK